MTKRAGKQFALGIIAFTIATFSCGTLFGVALAASDLLSARSTPSLDYVCAHHEATGY